MSSQIHNFFWSVTKRALVLVPVLLLAGCGKEEIQVYQIPKEKPASTPTPVVADQNAAPLHWTVPQGWQEKPASGVRVGDLIVPGPNGANAEVTIIPFPGSVGTELD